MSKFNQVVLRLAQQNPAFRKALVSDLKTADKWETLPKGWTDESRKEFWESLTSGSPKHKVTACIKKMEGKMDNPGAFCASLADRVTPGWRSKEGSEKTAATHADLKTVRDEPYFDPEWDADEKAVRMYFSDGMAEYLWADTPEEMVTWLDGVILRAKKSQTDLKQISKDIKKAKPLQRSWRRPLPSRISENNSRTC